MIRSPRTVRSGRRRSRPPQVAGRVHLYALRGLPALLEESGVRAAPLLRTVGLQPEDFADATSSAPFPVVDRLLGLCVASTRCAHFGLRLGQTLNLQSFGLVGRLSRHAPSVEHCLHELSQYFVLHDSGGGLSLSIRADGVTLSYGVHATGLRHLDQTHDLAVAGTIGIMRQLCGTDWRPDRAYFPHRRPADLRPYREWCRAPLRFDAVIAGIVFSERWLATPVADADPMLHDLLLATLQDTLRTSETPLAGEVRRAILALLPGGVCSRAAVADHIGLHPRTLGRRLQSLELSFQGLFDETRRELSEHLLRDTGAPVARVAAAVGYRDSTVFTRAFRRWTGHTPGGFRGGLAGRTGGGRASGR